MSLNSLFAKIAETRVMVIGDVMLDRFVRGKVARISPEAPVPVLRNAHEDMMLGGAGNVVRNLTALGAHVIFGGVIGADPSGQRVRHLVAADGLVTSILQEDAGRLTSEKTRFVADGHHLLRSDWDSEEPVSDETHRRLIAAVQGALDQVSVLILSDYGKGLFTAPVLRALISGARDAGKPVIVDPKSADYSVYRGASLITPNRAELAMAVGSTPVGTEAIAAAAQRLLTQHDIGAILVTRSEEGMTLVDAGGIRVNVHAQAREVFDVSGAGDTVVSTLAAVWSVGADLVDAVQLANTAAGLVVAKVGTAVVHPQEVLAAMAQQEPQAEDHKVLALPQLQEEIAGWRAQGLRVGFTNGCFDLIHPGHVRILSRARAECDRLVVGLNSDASVKRLKGSTRPIQDEVSRAEVLAALASVDAVTLFEDDTPLALIKAIKPDVLVKGADYREDQVVGADVVRQNGGHVVLVDLVPNQSTSNIARKIQFQSA